MMPQNKIQEKPTKVKITKIKLMNLWMEYSQGVKILFKKVE